MELNDLEVLSELLNTLKHQMGSEEKRSIIHSAEQIVDWMIIEKEEEEGIYE